MAKRTPIRRIQPWERLPQHHAEVVGGDQEVAVLETQGGDFKIQTKDHEYPLDPETAPEINIDADVVIIRKAVEISAIDLGVDGALEVEKLVKVFEDGTIIGDSWLATFLRGDVLRRGPFDLADLERRYNNGYFGAAIIKARVYVPAEGDVPEGSVAEHGKRGGIYYETKPRVKAGDVVAIKGRNHENIGIVSENQEQAPEGYVDVEIQSPYGNYIIPFKAEYVQVVKHNKPRAGQKERREKRQAAALAEVITQFANDFRTAKPNVTEHGVRETYMIDNQGYNRYNTEDGIHIYVPEDELGRVNAAALGLKSLLNYVSKMPPAAVLDLRKHVKRIVLSPVPNPRDSTVWGTMDIYGELTIYPDVKREGAGEEFGRGTFHGPNPPLPDVAVARVLTHEVGHAVYNHVMAELVPRYNDKAKLFWDVYEERGGFMPASTPRMNEVMAANGLPRDPTYGWRLAYLDAAEIERARYNATEQKIRSYDIPAELRSEMPPAHTAGYGEDKPVGSETYAWEELPPKVKAAFIEKAHAARPITGYAEKNEHEWYAEAYEYYRWGRLPSDHILYEHFENLPKLEKWLDSGAIEIKQVFHRHEPADWNNDEGLYHGHAEAPKGHSHEGA